MPNHFQHERQVFGTWVALRFFLRRRLSVLGYLLLAAATAYTFSVERDHSNENRQQLAAQTRTVLIRGCERQNDLRRTLQHVVLQSIPQVQQYVKDGTLTQAQANRAIANAHKTAKAVAPTNCAKVYPSSSSE
jgi:ABC-type lipoprotein release transport system permease subunit